MHGSLSPKIEMLLKIKLILILLYRRLISTVLQLEELENQK